MSTLLDTMVGEYRVLRLLGQGGMGEVYEATHPIIGKRVAVKVLKRELIEDSSLALRFIEEARAVNGIRHPSIVDVFGFGTLANGQLYLVMDLLEGESFSAYLKAHAPLEPQEAMGWLIELLDAIAAAHAAGVVHRDLKPSNLFLVGPRGKRTLKVLDFGIARRLKRDERLTHPNMLLGSPSYVSPEQIRGEAHFASDLYAIGCMAWAMLTGRTLFKGEVLDVLNQHLFEVPAPPSALVPGISHELDAFVLKLLAKEERDRPASAAVARDELRVMAHTAKSSPTRHDYQPLGARETLETEDGATPARALGADEPARTQAHSAPGRSEHTVVERRPGTETAPSLQRPATSTDTAPALHEPTPLPTRNLSPSPRGGEGRGEGVGELEARVAPGRNLAGLGAALVLLLAVGLGVFFATREPVEAAPVVAKAPSPLTPDPDEKSPRPAPTSDSPELAVKSSPTPAVGGTQTTPSPAVGKTPDGTQTTPSPAVGKTHDGAQTTPSPAVGKTPDGAQTTPSPAVGKTPDAAPKTPASVRAAPAAVGKIAEPPVRAPEVRAKPTPKTPAEELPSRDRPATAPTLSALDARLTRAEAAVRAGHARGGTNAAQLLSLIRASHGKARSAADRVDLEADLDEWERRYLPVK